MPFFHFRQNNPGGSFDFDPDAGITYHVIIEARELSDALDRASDVGIYFYGVESGTDCACCGDRWYEPFYDGGDDNPQIDGVPVKDVRESEWMPAGKEIAVHHMDGVIEWYGANGAYSGVMKTGASL